MARITNYDLYRVSPRWQFLGIETSDGRIGWGEPVLEGREDTTAKAVEELFETCLLGEDPGEIEKHWQTMYRNGFYRGGPVLMSAIAGIDQALWDLKGKEHGVPVYELLGGPVRDRIRIYQSVFGDTPQELAEAAQRAVDAGFTAIKCNPFAGLRSVPNPKTVETAVQSVAEIRKRVGPTVDVAIDCHGRVSKPCAKRIVSALEEYEPMFVEEPLLPEHLDSLKTVSESTTAPIATGERLFSRHDFKPILEEHAVDVVQPDLSHAGGITECKKIADMAGAYDVAVGPHCPLGPIALASCLQLDAACHNAIIQEQIIGQGMREDKHDVLTYLENPAVFHHEDGFVTPPEKPGLGVEINRDRVESNLTTGGFRPPVLHNEDGSVTEW